MISPKTSQPGLLVGMAVFVVGWYLFFRLAGFFEVLPGASVWFLPAGWTVAFVLVLGWRAWPITVLGPFLTGLLNYQSPADLLLHLPHDLRHAVFFGGAAMFLRFRLGVIPPLRSLREMGFFLGVILAMSFASALVAVAIFRLAGLGGRSEAFEILLGFWIGDAAGAVLITPCLAALLHPLTGIASGEDASAWRALLSRGFVLRLAVVLIFAWLAFAMPRLLGFDGQLGYLILLPLAWIALADGPNGIAVGVLVANLTAAVLIGHFGTSRSLFELQVLMLTATAAGLMIAAATEERDRALVLLQTQEQRLQQQVAARTRQLTVANRALLAENAERKQAEVAAQEAARIKGEFLANISHELRTPMSGIIGLSRLLLKTKLPDESWGYVKNINLSAESLLQLLDDILEFSKIEAGKLTVENVSFHLSEVLRLVLDMLRHDADAIGIDLRLEMARDVPDVLQGDPSRLRQVLFNLVGNAVKFTEEGEIVVAVVEEPSQVDISRIRLRFTVRDTGIGIAPDVLPRLFTPFTQADGSMSRRYGGTGLGLANCKRIIEFQDGEIGVDSTVGSGSLFWFVLPFELAATNPPENSEEERAFSERVDSRRRFRLLLVEDNPVNRMVAERLLESLGYRVDSAGTGLEALARIERQSYDLVLMDCQMPELDGYETTRRIRRQEDPSRRLPIIALTALAMDGDREKCFEAGMDDFVSKPFREEELALTIDRWLHRDS